VPFLVALFDRSRNIDKRSGVLLTVTCMYSSHLRCDTVGSAHAYIEVFDNGTNSLTWSYVVVKSDLVDT
jgi:hypothetical protein